MDCKQFKEWMSLKIDGVLDQEEEENFDHHMRNCEECRIEFEEYKSMISLIQDMEEKELPDGFHERLSRKLKEAGLEEEPTVHGSKPANWVKWLGAIAAVFVLLFSFKAFDSLKMDGKSGSSDNTDMKIMGDLQEEAPSLDIASIPSKSEERTDMAVSEELQNKESGKLSLTFDGKLNSIQQKEDRDSGEKSTAEKGEADGNSDRIETDLVKLMVQDVCITPSTLKMMAVNNGIEVVKSTEDSIVLKLANPEDREILYSELIRIGEIEDAGDKNDSVEVTIVIVRKE